MRKDQFIIQSRIETDHWWFKARRELLLNQIRSYAPQAKVIAEIGCGTGGNLKYFRENGFEVIGADIDDLAVEFARDKVDGIVHLGDFTTALKADWNRIDVVVLADILEHVEDDAAFLCRVCASIRPETLVLITVPAASGLWSQHDVILGHHRRYNTADFDKLLNAPENMQRVYRSHFNTYLFPLIFLYRLIDKLIKRDVADRTAGESHLSLPAAPINRLLYGIFAAERNRLGRGRTFNIGVSLLGILQKRGT